MAETRRKSKSFVKMIAFALVAFVVLAFAAFYPLVSPILCMVFPSRAMKEFNAGRTKLQQDNQQGRAVIEKAIADAKAQGDSIDSQMVMLRTYANLLYDAGNQQAGDQQIQALIDICPNPPPPASSMASILAHAYQDRGYYSHEQFLKTKVGSTGEADQQKAVDVSAKAFGEDSSEFIFKLPSLALIHCDIGKTDLANQEIAKAVSLVPKSSNTKWFVYALYSRILATEHQYPAALKAFLTSWNAAHGDHEHDRAWNEFMRGLKYEGNSPLPEVESAPKLLGQSKFSELDQLANRLRQDNTCLADGNWKIDYFYSRLLRRDDRLDDTDYAQQIFDLKRWLEQNPNSITARIALAESYTSYAWLARGSGYADSVSKLGWVQFEQRLALARGILDHDKQLDFKDPHAFAVYGRIAIGQSWPVKSFNSIVALCHKKFPTYLGADFSACQFFLPQWYGQPHQVSEYITARANALGGKAGDELYVRLVANVYEYLDLGPEGVIKFSRLKTGFDDLFADYPHDLAMRVKFLSVALASGHTGTELLQTFDSYTDIGKPTGSGTHTDIGKPTRAVKHTDIGKPTGSGTHTDIGKPTRAVRHTNIGKPTGSGTQRSANF